MLFLNFQSYTTLILHTGEKGQMKGIDRMVTLVRKKEHATLQYVINENGSNTFPFNSIT